MTYSDFTNLEAEQNLLGLILVNNSNYWKAAHLAGEDFFEPVHQRIFARCQKTLEAGEIVTPLLLKEQFDLDPALKDLGGSKYLMKLAKSVLNALDQVESLVELILKNSRFRGIHAVLTQALVDINTSDKKEPAELVARACMELEQAVNDARGKDAVTDNEILMKMIEDSAKPVRMFSTGLWKLDEAMGGGMIAGKAYGFGATKKSGKTSLLATIAENLNQSKVKTLYVALEMGQEQIMERIAARRLARNPIVFLTPERMQEAFREKLLHIRSSGYLSFMDHAGISFDVLKSVLLRAVRKHKLEVVIIDYWQLIGGKGKKSEREHLDEVAQWIAEFSKAYNVATVTASQINQEGNTRGGEGMRLAFDQVYKMNRIEMVKTDGIEIQSWFEMMDTRYTQWRDLGDEHNPVFRINSKGVFFEEL